ncbi:hypothetical protein B0H13DRAFT_2338091 [Mycena leptocephala]|nr:hypothetical protein B0H13DRAFT_2338091 [Mycena leptocephala]
MSLLENIADQKVLGGDGHDFLLYEHFFLKPLPADMFASYVTPSGIPPPALLVRIAGRSIRTGNNCDENDFLNESYICFRRRDNKPVRKTRACQVVNNADKLAQLDQNVSHVLDIADALLARENVKQAVAVKSHNFWRARQSMADLLRKFPSLITKADEEYSPSFGYPDNAVEGLQAPKVKMIPPSDPGPPATASAGQAVLPSERCAAIQPEIMMQKESEEIKRDSEVDVVDDPYQQFLIPPREDVG